MNNSKDGENISKNGSEVTELKSSVCENDEIDDQFRFNVPINLNSVEKLKENNSSDNVVSNSNHGNDRIISNNEDQTNVINSCEPNSQILSAMKMCTESSTDNEQISAIKQFNEDVNKNVETLEDPEKELGAAHSVIVNKNVTPDNSNSEEVKQLNGCSETVLKNNLFSTYSFNNNSKSLSENTNTHVEDACSSNINPIPNNFEMVTEDTLLGFSSLDNNTNKSSDLISTSADNSIVISNSNAVPQSDNIVSSNYSLSQLRAYGSDESLHNEPHEAATSYRVTNNEVDLCDKDSDSDSSSTSSSSSILISDSSDSESDCEFETATSMPPKPIKAKGELDLKDLPPIEDLKISVPEEECIPVGQVYKIVDQLVVIQAIKDSTALNLDTVLFSHDGKPFGKIFDVFGPVAEPYYCVRFNSSDQIKEKNISLNQTIYCAPNTQYTNYVFLAQLMMLKGSDASWKDDLEPPKQFLDYSDDEQERQAKKKTSRNKKITARKEPTDPDEPARKRHFSYEKKMNKRNLQLTAAGKKFEINRLVNSIWAPSSTSTECATPNYYTSNVPHPTFGTPPVFTERIFPVNVGCFPPRLDMLPPSHNMFPPRPNMFPPRPNMFPPRPDMYPPRQNMFPPRPNMFPPKPEVFPSGPNMFPPRSDMHPPRHDIYSPSSDMHITRSYMLPPRCDMYSPSPNTPLSRPDRHSPRNDMYPPSHDMHISRPDMHPPRPEMFPPKYNMFPPRHDMFSRPNMFPPRSPIHEPSNFTDPKSLVRCPLNSFQVSSPPGCSDPNTPSNFPQSLQPRISPGPMNNAHTFSPLGPSTLHDSQRLRNPYPNQTPSPTPTGNLWIQGSHSASFDTLPQSFWQTPQQNSPTQMPHAPPRPSPF